VALRALTCPFGPLMEPLPRSGALLDVGCGHGLLIHLLAADPLRRGLELHGIDHDPDKIRVAQRTARPGAEFSTRRLDAFAEASFDAACLVDVLYTVPLEAWPRILAGCRRVLRPGGILIVKEVVDRPRWKYWAILAQEALSVTVFGITKGERPHFEPPGVYRGAIAAAGLAVVDERPLAGASWISHYLFVARRPLYAPSAVKVCTAPDP
jgi:2-polyprenyl-3-methyl-5-hydroxy-6-metoxy-1,4-benzoquinol methylase